MKRKMIYNQLRLGNVDGLWKQAYQAWLVIRLQGVIQYE
jgi:hypothetical protein